MEVNIYSMNWLDRELYWRKKQTKPIFKSNDYHKSKIEEWKYIHGFFIVIAYLKEQYGVKKVKEEGNSN